MNFHIIGLKERDGEQFELDFVIRGGDENFIRDFLAVRGAVIVSIAEYPEEPSKFGNIMLAVVYKNQEVQIFVKGEDLEERLHYFASLGLAPQVFNFIENPIPEAQMKELIKNAFLKIKEEREMVQALNEQNQVAEAKKYEERGIKEGLKALNDNIDRMEQVLKIGEGIISGADYKKLSDMCDEMKKIRLGTNFNKMAEMVFDAQEFVWHLENQIFEELDDKKFLIDRNSYVTNIDVIKECFKSAKAKDKTTFDPSRMDLTESIYGFTGPVAIFGQFIAKDFINTFKASSINELFDILVRLMEYFVLTVIMVLTLSWLFAPIFGYEKFSLYSLPAFGWLGLLVYLLNNLNLNKLWMKVVGFIILAGIYWYGLYLLKNTFVF